MANFFDNLTARPVNPLQNLDTGEGPTPEERAGYDRLSANKAGSFENGMRRALYNASQTTDAFIGGMAEPYNPAFADRQFAKAEATQRGMPTNIGQEIESFRDVNSVGDAASYAAGALGEGAASMGGMLAVGLAARLGLGAAFRLGTAGRNVAQFVGGAAAMLPQEGGETALTLRNNPEAMANTTASERRNLTLGKGVAASAMESIVPTAVFASTIGGAAGRIASGMAPALGNIARKGAAGAVGEFATEGAQELSGQVAENLAVPGTGYDFERALEAGVRGAISGGVLGGAGGTVQAARSNIDAAAEKAADKTNTAANIAFEKFDNLIRNPEQAGYDLTNTTMGALAEAQARAQELGEKAGPAAASGMDAIAAIRAKFDRAVAGQLTPENRQKYVELTQNFRLLQPTEYERLRDAFDSGDTTQINEAIGDVAFQLKERVPRETMEGLDNLTKWAKKFGSGVTRAAREGRKAAQAYDDVAIDEYHGFLRRQYREVADTLSLLEPEARKSVTRVMMTLRDKAELLHPDSPQRVDPGQLRDLARKSGVELEELVDASRAYRTATMTRKEKAAALAETGTSPTSRIAEGGETFMTPAVQEQLDEAGLSIGPGVTFAEDGTTYDANGNIMSPEDPTNTPYTSRELVQRIQSVDTLGGKPNGRRPEYNIPVTYKSADGRITPEQIVRLLGSKDLVDNKEVRRDATDEEITARVEDGAVKGFISPVALAANTGKEANEGNPEQGGFKEVFSRFVPDFDKSNRDVGIQGYRLLSSLASLNSDGIELAPDQIPQSMWEELGITKDSEPLKITASLPEGGLDLNTVVQRKYRNGKRRDITLGDLLGANRGKRRLDAQKALLEEIAANPNEDNPARALNQLIENENNLTAEAALKGLQSFARDSKLSPNAAVAGYLQQLDARINDSDRKRRFGAARRALKDAYRAELITETQMEELRAYKAQEGAEQKSDVLDELAEYLQSDLDVNWKTDAELVEMVDDFLEEGMWEVDTARDEFEQNEVQEPTEDERFEAAMKSPEGGETRRMKAGIDQQNDAAVRAERAAAEQRRLSGESAAPTETDGQARIRKAKEKAGLIPPPTGQAQPTAATAAPVEGGKPERANYATQREFFAALKAWSTKEAAPTPAATPTPAQATTAADDGDGTLRKAKGKVADRGVLTIVTRNGETIERPIAGEFTLFGETFAVHKSVYGKGWAVSHKDTAAGIGIAGRKAISHAVEDAVKRLKELGRAKVAEAINKTRGNQQPIAPETNTETKTKTEKPGAVVRQKGETMAQARARAMGQQPQAPAPIEPKQVELTIEQNGTIQSVKSQPWEGGQLSETDTHTLEEVTTSMDGVAYVVRNKKSGQESIVQIDRKGKLSAQLDTPDDAPAAPITDIDFDQLKGVLSGEIISAMKTIQRNITRDDYGIETLERDAFRFLQKTARSAVTKQREKATPAPKAEKPGVLKRDKDETDAEWKARFKAAQGQQPQAPAQTAAAAAPSQTPETTETPQQRITRLQAERKQQRAQEKQQRSAVKTTRDAATPAATTPANTVVRQKGESMADARARAMGQQPQAPAQLTTVRVVPFVGLARAETENQINVLRKANTQQHYGNPFGVTGVNTSATVPNAGTGAEVSEKYRQWLTGEAHQDVEPQRREWINNQIASGALTGKTLLYFQNTEINHAKVLAALVNAAQQRPAETKTETNAEKVRRIRAEQAAATPTEPAKTTAKRPIPQKREGETNRDFLKRVRAEQVAAQQRPAETKTETNAEKVRRIRAEQAATTPTEPAKTKTETNAEKVRRIRAEQAATTPTEPAKTTAKRREGESNADFIKRMREQQASQTTEEADLAAEAAARDAADNAQKPVAGDVLTQIKATTTEEELNDLGVELLADPATTIEQAEEINTVVEFQRQRIKEAGAERFAQSIRDADSPLGKDSIRQRAVNNWAKKYLPDGVRVKVIEFAPNNKDMQYFAELRLARADTNGLGGMALPASVFNALGDGTNVIFVAPKRPGDDRISPMSILAHEFGHIIQHEMHYAHKESWTDILELYKNNLKDDFANTMSATRLFGARPDLVTEVEAGNISAAHALETARREMIAELNDISTPEALRKSIYRISFSEWFAEQFARYAVGDPNVFSQADPTVRARLDAIIATIKRFYNEVIKKHFTPDQTFVQYMESIAAIRNELAARPDRMNNILTRTLHDTEMKEKSMVEGLKLKAARDAKAAQGEQTAEETPPPPPPPEEGTTATPPPKEPPKKPAGETANARMIRERREAQANGQEPPAPPPPPQGPNDPPKAPPPPPDNEARAKFLAIVKRLLGDRVAVKFDEVLPEGIAGEYQNRFGQDLEDTGKALKAIQEQRRNEIKALQRRRGATAEEIADGKADPRTPAQIEESIASLNAQEKAYRDDLAIRGTIRVALGMEAQAGLAEHEAFHAAFAFFFGENNAADRKVLTTAFTRGVLSNRLMKYFAGNEEVLNVIDPTSKDFEAEEAAAYAFQVFLHEPGALQMGQKVEGIFHRFLAYLQRLVGYKTYEQRAKMIFDDLNSGRRAERGTSVLRDRVGMEKSMLARSQDFVRGVGTGFMHMYDTVLSSTYSRLEDSGNVAMAQIARLGYNETGQRGQGMIQLQRLATTKYGNQLKEALHALSAAELTDLNQAMILGEELTGRMGDAQRKLRTILREVHRYQTEAGTGISFRKEYYPMIWNPDKVAADYQGFVDMLAQYPDELAELMKTPGEIADSIVAWEERGHEFQGVFGKDGEPVADSSRRRSLGFIPNADRMKYMEDDLVTTMAHYLNQSVRHAEYVRAYGANGERLKTLMGEIRNTYGGTAGDVELAKDFIDGLMGNKEIGMSRELKDLYGAATVYQNVRLLPLSVFSSLVDPLGIAVRTGSMGAAFDTFAYSLRNMFTDFRSQSDWSPDQWEKYADDMGTIDMSGTVKSIDKIYTGVTLRGKTREINDAFFKYNLLNGWVKNNHIMATKAAQLFLRRSAEGVSGDRSAEDLREVGIDATDIVYDEKLGRIRSTAPEILGYQDVEAMEAQATEEEIKGAREQAERIQQAIHKIVRQSLIQPSSAEMPGWMSNPYLAPIAHLKTFVFGFNATILQRLVYEAERGNYSPIYYAAAYVPGMIAADFIKGFAGNGGEEPEWKKDWGLTDYVGYGVERSGLMGTGQFFKDMSGDVTRGGGGWETLAGPSIEQGTDLLRAMNGKTSQPVATWMLDAMPANALYDQWVKP